jgi:hypothetical protein
MATPAVTAIQNAAAAAPVLLPCQLPLLCHSCCCCCCWCPGPSHLWPKALCTEVHHHSALSISVNQQLCLLPEHLDCHRGQVGVVGGHLDEDVGDATRDGAELQVQAGTTWACASQHSWRARLQPACSLDYLQLMHTCTCSSCSPCQPSRERQQISRMCWCTRWVSPFSCTSSSRSFIETA